MDHSQVHTGAILAQDSRKFPEIPASEDFGEAKAGLHDVKQPGAAKRIVVGYNRNMGVPSHLPAQFYTLVRHEPAANELQ
jgi:hypothetical protein